MPARAELAKKRMITILATLLLVTLFCAVNIVVGMFAAGVFGFGPFRDRGARL
jgi:hypothetical protein